MHTTLDVFIANYIVLGILTLAMMEFADRKSGMNRMANDPILLRLFIFLSWPVVLSVFIYIIITGGGGNNDRMNGPGGSVG
jgi:hypothetical protein